MKTPVNRLRMPNQFRRWDHLIPNASPESSAAVA
jgi:hypothetical protein